MDIYICVLIAVAVKPGDANQLEITWPEFPKLKIPSSLSELVDLATASGTSAAAAVTSIAGKATDNIKSEEVVQLSNACNLPQSIIFL